MEQTINWVEPELKWVEFEANEYVAGCGRSVSITDKNDCYILGSVDGDNNSSVFVDVEGDGFKVQDVNDRANAAWRPKEHDYHYSCTPYQKDTGAQAYESFFIKDSLFDTFTGFLTGLAADTVIYKNGTWLLDSINTWMNGTGIGAGFKTGFTYDPTNPTPFTRYDETKAGNHS